MARKKYNKMEKSIWLKGYFYALRRTKKKKNNNYSNSYSKRPYSSPDYKVIKQVEKKKFVPPPKPDDMHSFLAFNDNGDVFNVTAIGDTREEALKKARKLLKRDPERPYLGVVIMERESDEKNYYRSIYIRPNNSIGDSWRGNYRSEDDKWRKMYPDLSKPVDGTGKGEFPRPKK